jgi:hypothetical protein
MSEHLKFATKKLVSSCLGALHKVAIEVRDITVLVFCCQHRKISYPRWHGDHIYLVCMKCGRKQLFEPNTSSGYGEFSHDLNELISHRRGISATDETHQEQTLRVPPSAQNLGN